MKTTVQKIEIFKKRRSLSVFHSLPQKLDRTILPRLLTETEKRAEPKIEKSPAKTPTISIGETSGTVAVVENGSKKTISQKLSEIFNRSGDEPMKSEVEKLPAIVEQKSPQIEENVPQKEAVERIVPIISIPEDVTAVAAARPEKSSMDLLTEMTNIPITSIRETGELDTDLIEDEGEEDSSASAEEVIEQVKRPQNFDYYILPRSEFLTASPPRIRIKEEEARTLAKELVEKTKGFNAPGHVVNICPGPVVTTYEFKPDLGVKYSRITGLSADLCLALEAESIRIDRIPGKAFVGIEVPNVERETIHLREVIESKKFDQSKSLLTLALGKTIDGLNYVADLAKMPHLYITGATGAGKSILIHTIICSILYKAKPDEVKFIMVGPKRLELGFYADIPHLATPIITEPKRAAISLKWAVSEMEKRYKDLAGWGVRNIDGFNSEVKKRNAVEQFDDNGEPWRTLPYIVIIIDEPSDLTADKDVQESIKALTQSGPAVGIHLVLATQRVPDKTIKQFIKEYFPSRISLRVISKIDSQTIIDADGAESLLGKGDMLFLPPATSQIIRLHGAFVDEKEIHKIVEHIKAQGNPEYDTTITKTEDELVDTDDLPGRRDALFVDALKTVVNSKRASTSLLQRHLRIGYGRAAAILDAMVHEGYIGDMDGDSRARQIMQKAYDDLQELEEGREL